MLNKEKCNIQDSCYMAWFTVMDMVTLCPVNSVDDDDSNSLHRNDDDICSSVLQKMTSTLRSHMVVLVDPWCMPAPFDPC